MMNNKTIAAYLCLTALFFSCKDSSNRDQIRLNVKVKNHKSTYLLLDQIQFDLLKPLKPDTLFLKAGEANKEMKTKEEGLYRIILPDDNVTVFFINDESKLALNIDASDLVYSNTPGNTALNKQLYDLIRYLNGIQQELNPLEIQMDQAVNTDNRTTADELTEKVNQLVKRYQQYLLSYADTTKSPVLSMFAFTNAQYGDAQQMLGFAQKLSKRFPNHEGVTAFLKALDTNAKKENTLSKSPSLGELAPDFTLNDVNDKPVSLSSFRGKYVLVDFWASWCGPCRGENPNVVAAFKKYNNKNFTVLGVSLDENKADWLDAIKEDGLNWTHISDLKGWQTGVVAQYGFDGIPYNVLVDPSGKILATSLRGDDLDQFLSKTLK
jgi:peroxiredoxin